MRSVNTPHFGLLLMKNITFAELQIDVNLLKSSQFYVAGHALPVMKRQTVSQSVHTVSSAAPPDVHCEERSDVVISGKAVDFADSFPAILLVLRDCTLALPRLRSGRRGPLGPRNVKPRSSAQMTDAVA